MPASRVSPARRTGQLATGFGALIVLIGLLAGAPIALLAFAGNPLPDHLPGLAEITTTLTSRDDGQLFIRALAIVGWLGWATFALSVLVELPARILRRPAIRLPGMRRQQRWAATLLGSVALILAVSPAATAATSVAATSVIAGTVAAAPAAHGAAATYPAPSRRPPTARPAARPARWNWTSRKRSTGWRRATTSGHIAGRYLGDFDRYRELAKLNEISQPDQIRPGQMLHLPPQAEDRGVRAHATGLATSPTPEPEWPESLPVAPARPTEPMPTHPPSSGDGAMYTVGASRAPEVNQLNRPLAVSAVIAVASIIGAQIGAVLGLRRRPEVERSLDIGRHRRS